MSSFSPSLIGRKEPTIIGQTTGIWIFLLAEGEQEEEIKGFLALHLAAETQRDRTGLSLPSVKEAMFIGGRERSHIVSG